MTACVFVLGLDGGDERTHRAAQQLLQLFDQPGALYRHAGLLADGRQQLEVMLREGRALGHGVPVDYSEDAVRRLDRHTHDRVNILKDDALRALIPFIGKSVRPKDGRPFPEAFLHDRAAEGGAAFGLRQRLPLASRDDLQAAGAGVLDEQEHAVGVDDLKDGVEDSIAEAMRVGFAADEIPDAVDGCQVPLHAAVVLYALELRGQLHQVAAVKPDPLLQLAARQVGNPGNEVHRALAAVRNAPELELHAAETNVIAGPKLPRLDPLVVDPGPVLTTQILDVKLVAAFRQAAVAPRHTHVEYLDIRLMAATDDQLPILNEAE